MLVPADFGRGVGLVERMDAHPSLGDERLVHPGQSRAAGELYQALVESDVEFADVGGRCGAGHLLDDGQQNITGSGVVAVEDFARRCAFDRLAGQVHVADVVGGHVYHEKTTVADGDQQSLLGETLHRPLANGPRLTPSLRASSASPSWAPGLSSP